MPNQDSDLPTESEIRSLLKALESSGVLEGGVDSLNLDEGKSKVLAELSRQGLGNITPDRFWHSPNHWFFWVPRLK